MKEAYYGVRNCFFEPTLTGKKGVVDLCLKRVEMAFKSKNPAIIGSHRLNFIGSIEKSNRDNNLLLFKNLLTKIINKWPDIEFLSTPELLNIIEAE